MKKSLVALAVLASIGSAFAQDKTTFTPYARLDVGVQSLTATGAAGDGLVAGYAIYNSQNWGIKGATDLGGGLKGFARVEYKLFTAVGNPRLANLGISGDFGKITLGTVWGPYDNVAAYGDAQDYNGFSAYATVVNSGVHWDNGNGGMSGSTTGSIQYTSPSYGGFVYEIGYAPSKSAGKDTSAFGVNFVYSGGPLTVAGVYDRTPTSVNNVAAASADAKTTAWRLDGSYDLGKVTVLGTVFGADASGTALGSDKDNGYALSIKVPVNKWTMSGGFGSVKTSGNDLNRTVSSFGMQALYSFNSNFTGYVGYMSTKTEPTVGASSTGTKFGSGLTMSF